MLTFCEFHVDSATRCHRRALLGSDRRGRHAVSAAIDGDPAPFGSGAAVAGRRRARSSGVALGFVQLEPFF